MAKINKVNQETLKNLNRQIILNYIRKYGEISRIDLAQQTRLSPTTVSTITSELLEKEMVTELRIGESSGGRKPVMLGINPSAKYAITIIITPKGAEYTLVNLDCVIIDRCHISCRIDSQDKAEEILLRCIDNIKNRYQGTKDKICGIGISTPGVVDHKNARIMYSNTLHLKDFDVASLINRYMNVKCYIYKDTDALILGEYKFGAGKNYKNFVYIIVENGVGMSYINSGKLFSPSFMGGFELGHTTVDSNGAVCRCGNRGCFGTTVSEEFVIGRLGKLLEKGYETEIHDISQIRLSDVVELSNKGDRAAKYVLEEQARFLGIGITNVVNMFNPQLIAIGGPLSKCEWDFVDQVGNVMRDRALEIFSRNVKIKFAELGSESALIGMANEIFENEIFKPVEF